MGAAVGAAFSYIPLFGGWALFPAHGSYWQRWMDSQEDDGEVHRL